MENLEQLPEFLSALASLLKEVLLLCNPYFGDSAFHGIRFMRNGISKLDRLCGGFI